MFRKVREICISALLLYTSLSDSVDPAAKGAIPSPRPQRSPGAIPAGSVPGKALSGGPGESGIREKAFLPFLSGNENTIRPYNGIFP